MHFTTKHEVSFTENGIECKGKSYSGYTGITKLIHFGEQSFRDKMIAQYGLQKAEEILSKSSARGNKIHENLETNWSTELPPRILEYLGECKVSELFLAGELFGLKCLGFADALFYNEKTNKWIIVDYKTKNKPYARLDCSKFFMQLVAYAGLIHKQFNISMQDIELAVILIYTDGSEPQLERMVFGQALKNVAYSVCQKAEKILASRLIA